ncbi:PQQ-binding-like beta-propeller repeat protein [Salinispira pacifica]|uniref:Serine/threonine protein kinase related protein n=1 Tax=Salinispira pacifica TaxID=1307761 RepID=V5WK82_9SPIO|nr:PQQ-binding-like beta-propeller repeat protein [Salinispira pacifica]AHC15994.1 Serine/threonine protein kinase related protein [Salinispira pacifica]
MSRQHMQGTRSRRHIPESQRHTSGILSAVSLRLLLLILAAGLVLASCSGRREWIEFRGNQGIGKAETAINPPIAVKWKLLLQKQEGDRRLFNQPLVLDSTIYFGSADGNFYSLDLNSGYMNWTFRSGGPINSVAYADDEQVYFGSSDGNIYALDRETGEEAWRFAARGQVNSTVIPYKNMIVAAADADAMYFLDRQGNLQFSLDNQVWHRNSFQIFNDILAFAPGSPQDPYNLTVYDLETEQYLWSLDESLDQYYWYSFPGVKNDRLFFSVTGLPPGRGWEHYFGAIGLHSGELLWERTEPAVLPGAGDPQLAVDYLLKNSLLLDYAAPVVWRNQVIYAMGDLQLRSFHAASGELRWKRSYERPVSTAPTLAGDRLYFGLEADPATNTGTLVCASPRDGSIHWTMEIQGSILNSPVIAGPWIIFGSDEGYFYVLEEVFP